jgi:uncharacterized cupredoxin-like copper-binding protein
MRAIALAFPALLFALPAFAQGPIKVYLYDNEIWLSSKSAHSGPVTFEVANHSGDSPHELVVIQTDLPDGRLPLAGDRVQENRLKVLGEAEALAPGQTRRLTLNLPAGHYVLICNQPGHYVAGMHTGLAVE